MTRKFRILQRQARNNIDGLLYWVQWGYSFNQYYGDVLSEKQIKHRFVGAGSEDYGYIIIAENDGIETSDRVFCDSCGALRFSFATTCELTNHYAPASPMETLEFGDTCIVHDIAKEAILNCECTGTQFSAVRNLAQTPGLWLMYPTCQARQSFLRFTTDLCDCGSQLQCSECGRFFTSCPICGKYLLDSFVDDPTSAEEESYCTVNLKDWNGNDMIGADGMTLVTGRFLEFFLSIGLFGYTFGPCIVESETAGSQDSRSLKEFIRFFDF